MNRSMVLEPVRTDTGIGSGSISRTGYLEPVPVSGDTPIPLSESQSQQTALPVEIFEAITDAIADALVVDYLADLRSTVDSPGGTNHE